MSLNISRSRSQTQPLGLVADNAPRQDHQEAKYLKEIADGTVISIIRQEYDERHVSQECIRHILMATIEGMRLYPKEEPTGPDLHIVR